MSEDIIGLRAYALEVYALAGMKERLLRLQDRYRLDVNAVLWCLWCARYGYGFEQEEVEAILDAAEPMAAHGVRALRHVRLFLSAPRQGFSSEALQRLRAEILKAEIAAEEMVLARLSEVSEAAGEPNLELGDMAPRAQRLFNLVRETMDRPTMIADEEGPLSVGVLFAEVCRLAEEEGP